MKKKLAMLLGCFVSACSTQNLVTPASDAPEARAVRLIPYLGANGKYGYSDRNGNLIISPKYDEATPFNFGRGSVKIGNKWGLVGLDGQWRVTPRFDRIDNSEEWAVGEKEIERIGTNGLSGAVLAGLSELGKFTLREARTDYFCIDPNDNVTKKTDLGCRAPVKDIKVPKEALLRQQLVLITNYFGPLFMVFRPDLTKKKQCDMRFCGDELFGYVNADGDLIAPIVYGYPKEPSHSFSDGPLLVSREGLYGYLDQNGREVIPPQYEKAGPFTNGFAWVKKGDKLAIIGGDGHVWTPFRFDSVREAYKGNHYIKVKLNADLWTVWDIEQDRPLLAALQSENENDIRVISNPHDATDGDSLYAVALRKGKYWHLFLRDGRMIDADDIEDVKEDAPLNMILAKRTGGWGAFNSMGNTVIQFGYQSEPLAAEYGAANSDLVRFVQNGRYLYIDNKGFAFTESPSSAH